MKVCFYFERGENALVIFFVFLVVDLIGNRVASMCLVCPFLTVANLHSGLRRPFHAEELEGN